MRAKLLALTMALAAGWATTGGTADAQAGRPIRRPAATRPSGLRMRSPLPGPVSFPKPTRGPTRPATVAPPGSPGAQGARAALVPTPHPLSANRLIYGVNIVWGDSGGGANWDKDAGAKARRLAQLVRSAGVTNTRVGIGWADVERARGRYDWRSTDRFMRFIRKLGVVPICVVAVTPDWALDHSSATLGLFSARGVANLAGVRAPEPAHYADLTRFAAACAQRYRGLIRHWEFWNEPDGMGMPIVVHDAAGRPVDIRYGGNPGVYTQLLKAFATGIRRADASARIAVGGLQVQQTDFLAGIYANGGRPYFDAVALHPYSARQVIAFDWVDRCRDLLVRKGDAAKPFWLTEWGWSTSQQGADGLTEAHQARLVRETFAGILARPFITQASYHTLNDWRTNEADPQSLVAMGLCSYGLQPKPAYAAFREAATGTRTTAARPAYAVPLVGLLPGTETGRVRPAIISVNVDGDRPGAAMPALWAGFTQGPGLDPGLLATKAAPRLAAVHAALVRFDPFPNPDAVRLVAAEPGGASAVGDRLRVDWSYADAVVAAIERHGAKPVLSFGTIPTAMLAPSGGPSAVGTPDAWTALLEQAARRYGQGPAASYWELAIDTGKGPGAQGAFLVAYTLFANSVRSAAPSARVGGPAAAGFDGDALRTFARECAAAGVPLDFLSWRPIGASATDIGRQVRQVRGFLSAEPSLRRTEVFIDEWGLSANAAVGNGGLAAAHYALSLEAELCGVEGVRTFCYELCDGPAGRRLAASGGGWGTLTGDGKPKAIYNALRLLARLQGARLPAISDETSVRVLAARQGARITVLLWRDLPESATRQDSDLPVLVRLTKLPWAQGSRGEVQVIDERHGGRSGIVGAGELGAGARFDAPPGDITVPVVLAQGRIAMVSLTGGSRPPVTISLTSPRYVVYGGSAVPVAVSVRSALARPVDVELKIACSDPAALPPPGQRTRHIRVTPGIGAVATFAVRPSVDADGVQEFVNVSATAPPLPTAHASVAVKAVSPLDAALVPWRVDVLPPSTSAERGKMAAQIRVLMLNRGDKPLAIELVCAGQRASARLAPHERAASTLSVPAPSWTPGNYPVEVEALLGGKRLATLRGEIGIPVLCLRAPQRPRIDGDLSEWQNARSIGIDGQEQGDGMPGGGARGLSAQVMAMWDEECLYIAATVTDDTFFQPYPADQMWRGDSLQVALDMRRDATPGRQGYDRDDAEIGIARVSGAPAVYRFAGAAGPGLIRSARAAVRRVDNRTLYEAAIPWSALGPVRPFAGGVMGLSIVLNNNDGRSRSVAQWAGGVAEAKEPGRFVAMRFVR